MPRYKISGSMGYAGTDWEDEVEADSVGKGAALANSAIEESEECRRWYR